MKQFSTLDQNLVAGQKTYGETALDDLKSTVLVDPHRVKLKVTASLRESGRIVVDETRSAFLFRISDTCSTLCPDHNHQCNKYLTGRVSELAVCSKKSTVSSQEIQTAVRLIHPGELSKHAISEGAKPVTKVWGHSLSFDYDYLYC